MIADNLALYVDQVYDQPADATGGALALATMGLRFQIYFNFSAYTDIAHGCSRVMGVELIKSFRGLSRAFGFGFLEALAYLADLLVRDYVYVPMGGNRVSHGTGSSMCWRSS